MRCFQVRDQWAVRCPGETEAARRGERLRLALISPSSLGQVIFPLWTSISQRQIGFNHLPRLIHGVVRQESKG